MDQNKPDMNQDRQDPNANRQPTEGSRDNIRGDQRSPGNQGGQRRDVPERNLEGDEGGISNRGVEEDLDTDEEVNRKKDLP